MKWIKRLRVTVDEMDRSGVRADRRSYPCQQPSSLGIVQQLPSSYLQPITDVLLRIPNVPSAASEGLRSSLPFCRRFVPCDVRPVRAGAVPTTHVSCLASTGTTRPGSIHRAVSEPSCRSIAVTNIQLQSCNRGTEVTTGSFLPLATAGVNVSYDSMNYRGTSPRAFSTHRTSSISRLRHAHTTSSNDAMRYSSFTSLPV